MSFKRRFFAIIISTFLFFGVLTGCDKTDDKTNEETDENYTSNASVPTELSKTDAEMFTDRDTDPTYKESECIKIELNGNSATASDNSVEISDGTITITQDATYIVSGTLNDGMLIVDAEDTAKMQIVLNGANITSADSAAIYILEADKVFLTLAEGTSNTLTNGGTFEAIDDNNIDATLFSKQDLTINGEGSLTVNSPAGHGIVSKDDLVITGGTQTVSCASHGLQANDSIRICDAHLCLDAGKDGIHAENSDDTSLGFVYISSGSFDIEAEGDGVDAYAVQIANVTMNILAGGGSVNGEKESSDTWGAMGPAPKMGDKKFGYEELNSTDDNSSSMKGIKAKNGLLIANGEYTIDSADDALHSDTVAVINGGTFDIASGDDAVHAEEKLTVTDGIINISESYEGLEALDIVILGGKINLTADDDGLNAAGGTDSSGTTGGRDGMFGGGPGGMSSGNGSIVISGGEINIKASGDGIDANGSIEISGGKIKVAGPTQGDTATMDYDTTATITGGSFIGTGASGMAQTFSDSKQGVISASVGSQKAGTTITVKDSKGNTILSHTPELSFQVVILSTPDIVSGETYTIEVGSTTGDMEAE